MTMNREAERRALRKARILESQRYRRQRKRRIDYAPCRAASALIDALTGHEYQPLGWLIGRRAHRSRNGCGASAAIDKLILAASELPEFRGLVQSSDKARNDSGGAVIAPSCDGPSGSTIGRTG